MGWVTLLQIMILMFWGYFIVYSLIKTWWRSRALANTVEHDMIYGKKRSGS